MALNTIRDPPNGSPSDEVDRTKLGDEYIDLQYAKSSSSAEDYVREPWKHHQDPVACYLSLRLSDRKDFYDKLTNPEKKRVKRETDRIEQARQRFSSWKNKRGLMNELEKYKTEWKKEARKNLEIFRHQNRELQQELEKQPRKDVGKYRGFTQELQELEQKAGSGEAPDSTAEHELVLGTTRDIREKIRRDEARIERLQSWDTSAQPSIGLPPSHNILRQRNMSLLKKSRDQTKQNRSTRAPAPAIDPPKSEEEKAQPGPLYGLKACAMYFCIDETSGTWVGKSHGNPRLDGTFPNQKIPMDEILNEEENPLMEPCRDSEIRYFHFPTNYMSWVEVSATNLRPRSRRPC